MISTLGFVEQCTGRLRPRLVQSGYARTKRSRRPRWLRVLCLSAMLAIQLLVLSTSSTAMMVQGGTLDAFGNPICSTHAIDDRSDHPGKKGDLACCAFCTALAQLSQIYPPDDAVVVFRPLVSNSGMSQSGEAPRLVDRSRPEAWPRAPPLLT